MKLRRRRWLACAARALAGGVVPAAGGPAWAGRPLRIVNAGAPGTVTDIVARQLATEVSPRLKQPVIVENMPSAGGIVALVEVKGAAPDGLTIGLVQSAQMCAAPSLFKHLPYDTLRDFAPIGILYRGPQVLVVHRSVPAASLGAFVELAKRQRLRYSSTGFGTPTHIVMELFKQRAGIDIEHIPYRGTAAHLAVLNAEVDALIEGVAPLLSLIRTGELRALAVSGSRRVTALPEVPTFAELGIDDIDSVWVGLVAPRATPPAVVAQLNHAFSQGILGPALRDDYERLGRVVSPGTPEQMHQAMVEETLRWRESIQRAGIEPS